MRKVHKAYNQLFGILRRQKIKLWRCNHCIFFVHSTRLSRVTEDRRAVRDQQEVDRDGHTHELRNGRSRRRRVRSVRQTSKARRPSHVELARTRHVHVARRLVRSRVQAEVDHEGTFVLRSVDVVATIRVWLVRRKELRLEVVVHVHAVRLDAKRGDGLAHIREDQAAGLSHGLLHILRRQEVGRGQRRDVRRNRHDTRRSRRQKRNAINIARETVPVAPLTHVAGGNRQAVARGLLLVELRAHTHEDRLNRPLEAGQKLLARLDGDVERLRAVHANQREADTLDVNIVNLGVHEDVVDVQINRLHLLGGNSRLRHDHRLERLVLRIRVQGHGGGRTLAGTSRGEDLGSETQEEVARGNRNELILTGKLQRDEALTIRDRHRRNRQTSVLVNDIPY